MKRGAWVDHATAVECFRGEPAASLMAWAQASARVILELRRRVGANDVDDDSLAVMTLLEGVKLRWAPPWDPEVV
jgi:hypothetical protein